MDKENKDLEEIIDDKDKLNINELELNYNILKHIMFPSNIKKVVKNNGEFTFIFKPKKKIIVCKIKGTYYSFLYVIPKEIFDEKYPEPTNIGEAFIKDKDMRKFLTTHTPEIVTISKKNNKYILKLPEELMKEVQLNINSCCVITKAPNDVGINIYSRDVFNKLYFNKNLIIH